MPNLDHWQQTDGPAKGFPKSDYFKVVHDAIADRGIQPESWWHGDPWEGAVVLDEDSLTNTRARPRRGHRSPAQSWHWAAECPGKA